MHALKSSSLHMTESNLSPAEAGIVARFLTDNSLVKSLRLQDNRIGSQGLASIAFIDL